MMTPETMMRLLREAGCCQEAADRVLSLWRCGRRQEARQVLACCRRAQLEQLHRAQQLLDRLDGFRYEQRAAPSRASCRARRL